MPDNDEIGNAGDSVVSPFARVVLTTEGSKETSQDHDEVGNNSKEDVGTVHTSEE